MSVNAYVPNKDVNAFRCPYAHDNTVALVKILDKFYCPECQKGPRQGLALLICVKCGEIEHCCVKSDKNTFQCADCWDESDDCDNCGRECEGLGQKTDNTAAELLLCPECWDADKNK